MGLDPVLHDRLPSKLLLEFQHLFPDRGGNALSTSVDTYPVARIAGSIGMPTPCGRPASAPD